MFAGVERNSLSFSDIQNLAEGGELTRATGPRFYKSFNSLNIRIKQDMQISIKASNNKRLIGNKYLPACSALAGLPALPALPALAELAERACY